MINNAVVNTMWLLALAVVVGCDGTPAPNSDPKDTDSGKLHFIDTSITDMSAIDYADVDADGDLDLLAANREGELYWYENTPSAFIEHFVVNGPRNTYDIDIVDFNQDGRLDIVTHDKTRNVVWLDGAWVNEGTFELTVITEGDRNGYVYNELEVADFNNDGILDLLYCGSLECHLLAFNDIDKTTFVTYHYHANAYVTNLKADDFNNDGWVDFSFTSFSGQTATVAKNQGQDGKFLMDTIFVEHAYGAAAVQDINLDGVVDLVGTIGVQLGQSHVARLQLSEGFKFSYLQLETDIPVSYHQSSFLVVDIEGDGDNDIVSTNASGSYYFFENGVDSDDEALPNFSFDPEQARGLMQVETNFVDVSARPIRITDLNNDGSLDIIANQLVNGQILWGDIRYLTQHPYIAESESE